MYVDSHCHLTDEQFADDLEAVIGRSLAAGVTQIVTLGTDLASSRAAISLAEKYPPVYAAVGIHPEAVREARPSDLQALRELAVHPKVVAIGEIGLDYFWDKTTADLQQKFFVEQLRLAGDVHLPVAIHDRDAHEKILETLGELEGLQLRGVLHAFSGDLEMAQAAMKMGYMISLGGPVTFKNARRTQEMAAQLPLEKMMLETDAPYLAPHPFRGKRNEPAHVSLIAARLAEIRDVNPEQVAAQTTQNARHLFGLPQVP